MRKGGKKNGAVDRRTGSLPVLGIVQRKGAGRADGASRNSGRCARLIPKIPVSPVRGAADPSREFGRRFRA